jgi:hypothetical protein
VSLRTTIDEVVTAHSWDDLARLAQQLPDKQQGGTLLLALAQGADAEPLSTALGSEAKLSAESVSLEGLAATPFPAWKSSHVIALFDAGRFFERADVDALLATIATRPAGTATIVLGGAEALNSAEDLAKIERNAWRLLVPDPKPEWAGQNLLEQGIVLWASTPGADFLTDRLARDRTALLDRVQRPLTAEAATLLRGQAELWLADQLDQRLADQPVVEQSTLTRDALELREVSEAVATAHRQIERRWQMSEESMLRSAQASLQMLEARATSGARSVLSGTGSGHGRAQADERMKAYLTQVATAWIAETTASLGELEIETRQDLNTCLRPVNWEAVNAAAAAAGRTERYPAELMAPLDAASSAWDTSTPLGPGGGLLHQPAPRFGGGLPMPGPLTTGAAIGIGVSVVSTSMIGVNPILAVVAGAVSGAAYVYKAQEGQSRRRLDAAEAYAQDVIGRMCRDLDAKLTSALQERSAEVEQAFMARIDELERWLREEADRADARARDTATGVVAERLRLKEARAQARAGRA